MNKIRKLISALLGLVVLTGCGGPEPAPTILPVETPMPLVETPTTQPAESATPTLTPPPTATPQPTVTPSPIPPPQPYPTPEWAPYEDEPFTIVFQRDGELWLSEVGGRGEWALTNEGAEWSVGEFAISPDGQTIAYIAKGAGRDRCVKLVSVVDGTSRVLAGEDDPYREFNIMWWDATRVAFQISPNPVRGYENDPSIWNEIQPYTVVVVDLETEEHVLEPAPCAQYRSPDGRYTLLRYGGSVRPTSEPHWLYDLETGEQWMVTDEDEETKFLSWSPNGRLMLFSLTYVWEDLLVSLVVDAETRTRRVVTTEDKVAHSGAWSPESHAIAYVQCDPPTSGCQNPELWLTSPDGANRHPIPMGESMNRGPVWKDNTITYASKIFWAPDGSRLMFEALHTFSVQENIWSVRLDGTDLRPIAKGYEYQVLPAP